MLQPELMPDTTISGGVPNAPSRAGADAQTRGSVEGVRGNARASGHLDGFGVEMLVGVDQADRRAGAAPVGVRCDNEHVVAGVSQRSREYVNALRLDTVVIRDQQSHKSVIRDSGSTVARPVRGCGRRIRTAAT